MMRRRAVYCGEDSIGNLIRMYKITLEREGEKNPNYLPRDFFFFQFSRSIIGLQKIVIFALEDIAMRGGWVKAKFYMYNRSRLVFLRFKTNKT